MEFKEFSTTDELKAQIALNVAEQGSQGAMKLAPVLNNIVDLLVGGGNNSLHVVKVTYFGSMIIDENEHLWDLNQEVKKKLISDINNTQGLKILYWINVGWPMGANVWASISVVKKDGVYKPTCATIRFDVQTQEFYYINKYI